jgi:hypothetical protein
LNRLFIFTRKLIQQVRCPAGRDFLIRRSYGGNIAKPLEFRGLYLTQWEARVQKNGAGVIGIKMKDSGLENGLFP